MISIRPPLAASKALLLGGFLAAVAGTPVTAAPTTWYVNGASPSCTNSGPGDAATPFCTIQKGASRAVAGDTVLVSPGTYREQVTLRNSGQAGAPITFLATGPSAAVVGSVDISRADKWRQASNHAWRKSINFTPRQVFVDGARLADATAAGDTTTNSFFFDAAAQFLYVNIGGANPGIGHTVEASKGTYGFNVVGLNNIVIDGFEVKSQNSANVRVVNSSAITIRNLDVSFAGTYGIRIEACSSPVLVKDCTVGESISNGILLLRSTGVTVKENRSYHNGFHGISLQSSSNNTVLENKSFANFRWNVRSATGIDVSQGSTGNTIQANTVYANQDSGIQVYSGSNVNTVARNVSWGNGDHGFDTNRSIGTRYLSNTSCRNYKDGFSVEGGAKSTTFYNNLGVDNGLATREYDLYVDDESASGLRSDFNIFWNSAPGTAIRVNNRSFATLTDFRSTGNEAHGIDADPQFVDAVESMNLSLAPGSPAIDSASSAAPGFIARDRDGYLPADAPDVYNSGSGDMTYADRGAFEWDPPPTAALRLSPVAGEIDLIVTADASDSIDLDDRPIVSYTFDFGDGTVMGPAAEPACSHTYSVPGRYGVVVTVTDKAGKSTTAASSVLAQDHPPGARLTVNPLSGVINLPVTADASASRGTEFTPIASYTFDFGDGTVMGPQLSPVANHTYTTPGFFTVYLTVTNDAGDSTLASELVRVIDEPPTALLNVSPVLGIIGLTVTADASGSFDVDSAPISSYMFDFGDGFIMGPQVSPTASHTYVSAGDFTVTVTVSDTLGSLTMTTAGVRVVENSAPASLLRVTPAVGRKPLGVIADASDSTDTDPAPIASYTFDFGDGTIVGPQAAPAALHIYRKKGIYTISVTVTDSAGLSTRASMAVKVKKKGHRKH